MGESVKIRGGLDFQLGDVTGKAGFPDVDLETAHKLIDAWATMVKQQNDEIQAKKNENTNE